MVKNIRNFENKAKNNELLTNKQDLRLFLLVFCQFLAIFMSF